MQTGYEPSSFLPSQGLLHTSKGTRAQMTLLTHKSVSEVELANSLTLILTPQPLLCGERSMGL